MFPCFWRKPMRTGTLVVGSRMSDGKRCIMRPWYMELCWFQNMLNQGNRRNTRRPGKYVRSWSRHLTK